MNVMCVRKAKSGDHLSLPTPLGNMCDIMHLSSSSAYHSSLLVVHNGWMMGGVGCEKLRIKPSGVQLERHCMYVYNKYYTKIFACVYY